MQSKPDEIEKLIKKLPSVPSDEDLEPIIIKKCNDFFTILDQNQDGQVTFDEVLDQFGKEWDEARRKKERERFTEINTNNDKYISYEEIYFWYLQSLKRELGLMPPDPPQQQKKKVPGKKNAVVSKPAEIKIRQIWKLPSGTYKTVKQMPSGGTCAVFQVKCTSVLD
jgi:hypothetical protein